MSRPPRPLTDAQRDLAGQWIRLAFKVAREFNGRLPADLLDSEAMLALCDAARGFDPARGFKFSTYATWAIRYRIMRAISKQAAMLARRREVCEEDGTGVVDQHAGPAETAEARDVATAARRLLPKRAWRILWAHFSRGETYAVVGARLGVSRQAANGTARAALRRLREELVNG